jgi:hypothetical protein
MENEFEFAGSALATTFVLRALVTLLFDKGILSHDECTGMFDRVLLTLEQQQNIDCLENAEIWWAARKFLEYLVAHPMLAETILATNETENKGY